MSEPGARGAAHETAAAEPAASTGRFIAGDPLRAVAALGVLVFHAFVVSILIGDPTARVGSDLMGRVAEVLVLGLYVFFVLSGYLLGRPYVHAFVQRRPRPGTRDYLRNRALRIVPGFWLAVTLTIIVFGTSGAGGRQLAALYLFAQELEPSQLSNHILQGCTIGAEVFSTCCSHSRRSCWACSGPG